MLDYLRNLTKSEEDKRQENLTAYLDEALSPKERKQVESDLAQDKELTAELDQMRLLQQQMRQLPQRRVRRNFTLDPALYGRPRREPLVQAYPVLRTATALAAFLFIFVLAANLFLGGAGGAMSGAESAMAPAASSEGVIAEAPVEEAAEIAAEEVVEEALMLEAEAEPPAFEEMPVDPDLAGPLAEAESALEGQETDPNMAVPMERDTLTDKPETDGEAADSAAAVAPTLAAVGTDVAQQAGDLVVKATIEAAPPVEQLEPRALGGAGKDEVEETIIDESQADTDEGLLASRGLGLIASLLGLIFVILVILTFLARRRL